MKLTLIYINRMFLSICDTLKLKSCGLFAVYFCKMRFICVKVDKRQKCWKRWYIRVCGTLWKLVKSLCHISSPSFCAKESLIDYQAFFFCFAIIENWDSNSSSMCDGLPLGRGARTYNRILRSKDKAKPCRVSPTFCTIEY